MERQHFKVVTAALALGLLTACGAPVAPMARLHTESLPAVAAAPATGAIQIAFRLPAPKGFTLQATPDDVAKVTVALKTKSFLFLTTTVANAEVTRAQMLANKAAINFTGLKAGNYTLDIKALDSAGTTIGTSSTGGTVTDGQTTTVNAQLQIDRSIKAASLGVDLQIVNGQ